MTIDRRRFLQQTSLGAFALATGALLPHATAIEPIARHSGPKFKFSLAAYSYREFLLGKKEPKLTLFDFVDDCAKFGCEGTELTSYYFPEPLPEDYLARLKTHAFRLGLDITGTAVGNDFCHPAGPARDEQIALVKKWIARSAALDAPVIRIFSGKAKPGQSVEDARRLAIAAIEECCAVAGQAGVILALENHGGLTEKADDMLEIVKAVQSPYFAVNLDTGNFHSSDIYGDLAKLAPYAVNVQIKVVIKPENGQKEPADFSKLARMLTDSGYRGYIVLEYEESENPREMCPKYLEQLREAFKA